MKVALLHDWLNGFRGGERILKVFCEMFPTAPIYTLFYQPGTVDPLIEKRKIYSCFANEFSLVQKHYRKFFPLYPWLLETMELKENYDLIISSSHCVIKGLKIPHRTKHFCYLHSPMRYMYDQFDSYFPNPWDLQGLAARIIRPFFQLWDRSANDSIDVMVANSDFVAKRVWDCYQRKVDVIHPFVDLQDFRQWQKKPPKKEDFFLMVTAFAPNKRVDLAIKAFNQLKLPLLIIGGGQEETTLKNLSEGNIQFLGNVTREKVLDYLFKAQALIFPGVEDFGITPLEALSAGTPVIAYKAGGVLETLNEEVAVFFEGSTEEEKLFNLVTAVKNFSLIHFDRQKLQARAEHFSKEIFIKKISNELEKLLL